MLQVFAPTFFYVYGIKCIGEIFKHFCYFEIFCPNSFYDSIDCQNLWYGSICQKTVLIFLNNFLNFRFDTVEKQSIIYLISNRIKNYASIVLGDSEIILVGGREGRMQPFVQLSIVFCLYAALQNRRSKSSNFIIFHTSGGNSSRPAAFLL